MDKHYDKALVIFMDILGSQNRDNFEELYKINSMFHRELEKQQQNDKDYTVTQRHVYTFSDCAYIIYDFKENISDSRKDIGHLFHQALYNTEQLIQRMLKGRFICRGGIAYGDVYYEENRSLLFGPAINKAYYLESKIAKFPRVVVDSFVVEQVSAFISDLINKVPEDFKSIIYQTNGKIIATDDDGQYYLNYFNSIKQGHNYLEGCLLLDELTCLSDEEIRKQLVIKESTEDSDMKRRCESIIQKYEWLKKYIIASQPENSSGQVIIQDS
ncbi:hypothetical protein [Clostridium sp. BNL1100]|uniref:hypothetical protein n=1 Tax=Clostridium sp. BNL1100 TaxID=755731 RepID=UPI00024A7D2A|nr:hypothetical protein [Clostridium sp. BNL1100]AEY67523.1 hypothetical protein Clo1100_3389 [Clostridium sp. BNL1100]